MGKASRKKIAHFAKPAEVRIVTHAAKLSSTHTVFLLLIILSCFFLAIITFKRNLLWNNGLVIWEDVIRKGPDKARGHTNLGNAYSNLSRIGDAIKEYQKAIRLNPDITHTYNNLGAAYYKLARTDDAIKEYQKAIGLKPNDAKIHYNLGIAFEQKGLKEQALKQYKEVLRIMPDFIDARRALDRLNSKP